MKLIEVDALDTERAAARLAGSDEMLGAAIGNPRALRPGEAAFGCNAYSRLRSVAAVARECVRDQPLVVPGLRRVPAIRIGGVEQRHTGIECRVEDGHGAFVVAIALGRQPHAAHRDERCRRAVGPHVLEV
jgi:hypothetical protein